SDDVARLLGLDHRRPDHHGVDQPAGHREEPEGEDDAGDDQARTADLDRTRGGNFGPTPVGPPQVDPGAQRRLAGGGSAAPDHWPAPRGKLARSAPVAGSCSTLAISAPIASCGPATAIDGGGAAWPAGTSASSGAGTGVVSASAISRSPSSSTAIGGSAPGSRWRSGANAGGGGVSPGPESTGARTVTPSANGMSARATMSRTVAGR